jgi:quercetin dioxygenase-like cupin family protein
MTNSKEQVSSDTNAQSTLGMKIVRVGSTSSLNGPADYFTGNVRIDPLFQAAGPSRVSGGLVTFEPGALSAWHNSTK